MDPNMNPTKAEENKTQPKLGRNPEQVECPHCHAMGMSRTEKQGSGIGRYASTLLKITSCYIYMKDSKLTCPLHQFRQPSLRGAVRMSLGRAPGNEPSRCRSLLHQLWSEGGDLGRYAHRRNWSTRCSCSSCWCLRSARISICLGLRLSTGQGDCGFHDWKGIDQVGGGDTCVFTAAPLYQRSFLSYFYIWSYKRTLRALISPRVNAYAPPENVTTPKPHS
jgi:hypothetical protein